MSELKQKIRNALPLTSLIGESVSLQNRNGQAVGLCPFHDEKTPSFYVYDDHYHCFGCGAHGDAISFVRKIQGLPFVEALRWLAEKAGIPADELDRDKSRARERQKEHKKAQILQVAKEFFCDRLSSSDGQKARNYLQERGLSQDQDAIGFGFAPDEADALCKHLLRLGFKDRELEECSLMNRGKFRSYDFFQNRLIIPVRDEQGRLIAFGGRTLGDEQPKYKNSRYDKSYYLFGLDRARQAVRKKGRVIVVEGYLDAIQMWTKGFDEAVACQGTALTFEHIRKLDALTTNIILLFDGDQAGLKAGMKVLEHAFSFSRLFFKVALLPPGEDPDTFLRKEGPDKLENLLQKAEDLLAYTINSKLQNAPDTGLPELIRSTILPWLGNLKDPLRRAFFVQKLSTLTGIPSGLLSKDIKPFASKVSDASLTEADSSPTELLPLEKEFLAHLYFSAPQNISLQEVRQLMDEHLELEGKWHDFALEILSCLTQKAEPAKRDLGTWQSAFDSQVVEFLELLRSKSKAYQQDQKIQPFTRLRLEAKKRNLKLSLDSLKKQTLHGQWEMKKNPEMWSLLTHSLLKTTKELAVIDSLLRDQGQARLQPHEGKR